MVPSAVRTSTTAPRRTPRRGSSAPPPVCTEWPAMTVDPVSEPGWALRSHHPTSTTSCGGSSTRSSVRATGTTGASMSTEGTSSSTGSAGSSDR